MPAGWQWAPVMLAAGMLLGGCATVVPGAADVDERTRADRALVLGLFAAGNAAGARGAQAQAEYFAASQHPAFPVDLGDCADPVQQDLTVLAEPTVSTVRLDPDWRYPDRDGAVPAGRVYVVAVALTLEQAGNEVASAIATQHVVVLDGRAVSFTPCLG